MVDKNLDMTEVPEWLDNQAGAQLLGVKQSKFFYHVERGEIAIKPGSTRKERMYNAKDILLVKERLQRRKRRPVPVVFDWLYEKDVPAGLKLDHSVYDAEGVDLAEAAIYQSWRRRNNHLTMAAFSKDRSECFAYVQLVPLDEQVILDILSGKREESSIIPEEVEAYDRSGAYNLLCASVVVHPDRPELLYSVLQRMMDFWAEQYPERWIDHIYAQAMSKQGDLLIQSFFMAPRYDLANNAYVLDLTRPGRARMIRKFQTALAEKAAANISA